VIFKIYSHKRFLLFLIGALSSDFHCNHFPRAKYIVIGRCFVFGFKQSNLGYLLRIRFVCNEAKYYESKTKRHRPKILGGNEKRPEAKAKTDRSIKTERCVGQVF